MREAQADTAGKRSPAARIEWKKGLIGARRSKKKGVAMKKKQKRGDIPRRKG